LEEDVSIFEIFESPQSSLKVSTRADRKKAVEGILAQRDEILKAFIAKYGLPPEECEQVLYQDPVNGNYHWYIRKRINHWED
jgi:hypothetical protein